MASDNPALKEMLDAARFAAIAGELTALQPDFERARFLKLGLAGLDTLSLVQRLRRMSAALHATLPPNYARRCRYCARLRRASATALPRGYCPTMWAVMACTSSSYRCRRWNFSQHSGLRNLACGHSCAPTRCARWPSWSAGHARPAMRCGA
jgi:hypothetical protein